MPTENIDYTDKATGDNFTAADANDIKSAVNTNAGLQFINAPVLSSLPAVNASKAGELFYYNGTLWTYAKTGQFGTLAEGTPWPVKGYKEISALGEYDRGILSITYYANDPDENMGSVANTDTYSDLVANDGLVTFENAQIQQSVYGTKEKEPLASYCEPVTTSQANDTLRILYPSTTDFADIEIRFTAKIYPPQS